jgi:RNA polymerase sigma-70 factor, ECF subfamily
VVDYSAFSDERLVKACVGSDNEAAWAEFIRRYQPLIARVVLKTARHWEEPQRFRIDDLVQDTYAKLCADECAILGRFQSRHEGSIYGLLGFVAASVVHDFYKSQRAIKRDSTHTEELSEFEGMDPPATDGSVQSIERRLDLLKIDQTITRVCPPKNRERNRMIFWLHHRNGMTAKEIAAIPGIGLDVKGVETTLLRMKDLIEDELAPEREEISRKSSL